MSKEDRQIVWKADVCSIAGYYKENLMFSLWHATNYKVYAQFPHSVDFLKIGEYTTLSTAKRGVERFLRRLQEAVK